MFASTVRVLNDVDETIRELSVRLWRSVCAEHKMGKCRDNPCGCPV